MTPAPVPDWLTALLGEHRASHAPHYSPAGLSDHGPMAYLAMHGLGFGQREIERFATAYRPRLAPLPGATVELREGDARAHFGRLDAYPSLLRFFDTEIGALGTTGAVSRYLPELISAWVTDAFHALIRLSYGVEFGVPSEVAAGLAYLAGVGENTLLARASGLPVTATEGRDFLLALRAYRGAKSAVAPRPFNQRYREVLETVDLRPSGAVGARPKLERACLDVFHATHDFFALHLVTASHAFRVCAPFAGPNADRIFSVGIGAAYLAIGAPDFRPVESSEGGLPLDRLATANDEHDIKIAYTAQASARAHSDPTYEWVARRYLEGRLG